MLSKTSCSKLLRKNLTRFAPLWALYSLFLMLCIAICASGDGLNYWFVSGFLGMMNTMPIFSCGYAFLTANLLFGDLYTPRMCYSLHAFPVKRDILFKANVTAGILAAVVPNGIFALICAPLLAQASVPGAAALAWWFFLASSLGYLFFFGTAVLCAMLAGNRLGHAALYGVVSLGGGLAYFLVDTVFTPMLYGVLTPGRPFRLLSPVVYMVDRIPLIELTCESKRVGNTVEYWGTYTLASGWGYMAGMAALGLVLLGVALWLYRRRALEKAGDFLAVDHLDSLVLVALSLCAGTVFTVVGSTIEHKLALLFLAVGVVVGWFAGEMLLKRSTRVFSGRSFLGLGTLVLVLAVSLGLTKLDVLGIEDRIPASGQAERILLDGSIQVNPEDYELVRTFHSQGLADRVTDADRMAYAREDSPRIYSYTILYELGGGRDMRRNYSVKEGTPAWESARKLASSVPAVMMYSGGYRRDETLNDAAFLNQTGQPLHITVINRQLPPELVNQQTVDKLLNAMLQDIHEGNFAQEDAFHPAIDLPEVEGRIYSYDLSMSFPGEEPEQERYLYLRFYEDSVHTLQALEELGISREDLRSAMTQNFQSRYFG